MLPNTPPTGRLLALLLLFFCAWPLASSRAEILVPGIEIDPASGIDMKVTAIFKELPKAGYATLQIYIHNTSGDARSWTFNFVSSSYRQESFNSSRQFTVQNKAEQTFEVIVPISTNASPSYTYSMTNLQISVSGYGVTRGMGGLTSSGSSGHTLTDFVLMSQALTVRSWGPLEKACTDKGDELQGCEFNPYYLPTDWRGYLGAGSLWMTDTEWQQALDPVLRNAIHEWVVQGGTLVICSTTARQPGEFGFNDVRPGYGNLVLMQWGGRELDPSEVMPMILSPSHSVATNLEGGYQAKWDLFGAVGQLEYSGVFIMLFVICFGVVIGPVNLFWFAKTGHRHRLFWTTPLISIAGSLVLAGVIVLQDGFGGSGRRMVLVQLIPGDNEAVVAQEQVSRTGLLLSSHFTTEDKVFIAPIFNVPFISSASRGINANNQRSFTVDVNACSGDWFSSRSMQAQLLEVIRPSRARIEIVPAGNGAAPELHSSVENDLLQVFYIDDDGHYWKTDRTQVGQKKTMQPSTEADFDTWMAANASEAGARINTMLSEAGKRRGYFYAVADDPKNDAIATLPSIRWSNAKTIYLGPCAVEAAASKP